MAVSDIETNEPSVGVPALTRKETSENWIEIKVALLDHEDRIEDLEASGAVSSLDTLSDVTLTTPSNGESLVFSGGVWVNQTPAGGGDMVEATYDPQAIGDDAFDRANHTGAQAISDTAGLQAALDAKLDDSEVGTGNNQLVRLDGSARLPAVDGSQLTNLSADVSLNFSAKGSILAGKGSGTFDEFTAGADGDLLGYDSAEDEGLVARTTATPDELDLINRAEIDYANDLFLVWDDSASALKKIDAAQLVDPGVSRPSDAFTISAADFGTFFDLQAGAEAGGTVDEMRDGQVILVLNRSGDDVDLAAGSNVTLSPSTPTIPDGLMAVLVCAKPSTQSLVFVAVQAVPA